MYPPLWTSLLVAMHDDTEKQIYRCRSYFSWINMTTQIQRGQCCWFLPLLTSLMLDTDVQLAKNFIIIYLSLINCGWLLFQEVQWFYWTQELLVPAEKFSVRMPMVRLELTTPRLETECSSHWPNKLNKLLLGKSWVYPGQLDKLSSFPAIAYWSC